MWNLKNKQANVIDIGSRLMVAKTKVEGRKWEKWVKVGKRYKTSSFKTNKPSDQSLSRVQLSATP